jgi:hypothetical protein
MAKANWRGAGSPSPRYLLKIISTFRIKELFFSSELAHSVFVGTETNGSGKMAIKINSKFISVNGKRAGVTYATGPWINGVDQTTIKIRPKKYSFPREIAEAFVIENNSDGMTDYFEKDCIRITSAHPLYAQVKEAAL